VRPKRRDAPVAHQRVRNRPLNRPALSDDQWLVVSGLLETTDPKWRTQIDHILSFCGSLIRLHEESAARARDYQRGKRAAEILQKAARILKQLEVDKPADVLDALNLCINRLNANYGQTFRANLAPRRKKERFAERDSASICSFRNSGGK
jgi:hypothetical protein